jgi:hypothetical protein
MHPTRGRGSPATACSTSASLLSRAAIFSRVWSPRSRVSPTLTASSKTSRSEVGLRVKISGSFFSPAIALSTRLVETAQTSQRPWVTIRSGASSSRSPTFKA